MTGTLAVMDRTGHLEVKWDREKPEEVQAAKETFEKMKKRGMRPTG